MTLCLCLPLSASLLVCLLACLTHSLTLQVGLKQLARSYFVATGVPEDASVLHELDRVMSCWHVQ